MKKNTVLVSLVLIVILIIIGCGGNTPSQEIIEIAGSTSMEKLSNALAEGFMNQNRDITVTAEFIGSSAGIEAMLSGRADIGNTSRELKDSEKSSGAYENVVAIDTIAVITNPSSRIAELSAEQLRAVFTGEARDWGEIGKKNAAIVVVGREAGSGTRDVFEELLDIKDRCSYSNELDSTGAVLAKVRTTPGAVGYISMDVLDGSVAAVSIDSAEPTEENILSGKYPLSRPFVMATKGELSGQSEAIKKWFDYINSDEGRKIIRGAGLVPAD